MERIDALLGESFPPTALGDTNVVENVEHEDVDADGRTHTVLVTVRSVDIEAGSVLYSVRDITTRKAQEERFRAYVENSSDVFTVIDADRTVEYVSPSVERILGYRPAELIDRDPLELVHPDDRGEVVEVIESVDEVSAETTISVRYRTRHADDSWVWTESRLTTAGQVLDGELVVNTRDVTELREREGRLSVLDRVLRHNLRNKLNVVLGAVEKLEEELDGEGRESLDLVATATEDLLRISEKARRFDSAIRRSAGPTAPIDLAATARRVVEEKRLEYPDAEIRTAFPPTAWVRAGDSIGLAMAELVDNAVLHAEAAAATVEVAIEVGDATATLAVSDAGPGIPEMDRAVVRRGKESPLEHGMNIGLWLVRWTVDNSDGTLEVLENEPTGTRIEATFQRAEPPEEG